MRVKQVFYLLAALFIFTVNIVSEAKNKESPNKPPTELIEQMKSVKTILISFDTDLLGDNIDVAFASGASATELINKDVAIERQISYLIPQKELEKKFLTTSLEKLGFKVVIDKKEKHDCEINMKMNAKSHWDLLDSDMGAWSNKSTWKLNGFEVSGYVEINLVNGKSWKEHYKGIVSIDNNNTYKKLSNSLVLINPCNRLFCEMITRVLGAKQVLPLANVDINSDAESRGYFVEYIGKYADPSVLKILEILQYIEKDEIVKSKIKAAIATLNQVSTSNNEYLEPEDIFPGIESRKEVIQGRRIEENLEKFRKKELDITSSLESIINQKDGTKLILIPGGEFICGSDMKAEGGCQFIVNLPSYYIAETEVTNAQYKKFVDETGHRPPVCSYDSKYNVRTGNTFPANLANHPVVNVSWDDAKAYCDWAGLHLPSELEWEKGARGMDGKNYPWGNTWDANKCCNYNISKGTSEVASFTSDKSPYGLYDTAGNVHEWCEDWYDENAYDRYMKGNLVLPSIGSFREVRGGSWSIVDSSYFRCAKRYTNASNRCESNLGFRCAKTF